MEKAQANGGNVELKTVSGGKLWVMTTGSGLTVRSKGRVGAHHYRDVHSQSGVIQVIDTVLMPKRESASSEAALIPPLENYNKEK